MCIFKTEIKTKEEARALQHTYFELLVNAEFRSEEEIYYCSKIIEIAEILKAIEE